MTLEDIIKKYKPYEIDFIFPNPNDTHAYLDLFFVYNSPDVRWHKVHTLIIEYFNHYLKLYRSNSISAEELVDHLHFPEVSYIALGHCLKGVKGFGSGKNRAYIIKDSIFDNEEVYKVGLPALAKTSITIGGLGPDLLSDMIANFGMHHLLEYTDEQVKNYNLKTAEFQIPRALNLETFEWDPLQKVKLPYFEKTGQPRILVPKHIVKKLPVFTTSGYYNNYLQYLLQEEKGDKVKNIKTLARAPKVSLGQIKEELINKYETIGEATRTLGLEKQNDIEQYVRDPFKYKKYHTKKPKEKINWSEYSKEISSIPPGRDNAYRYADIVRKIFTVLYGDSLVNGILEEHSSDGIYRYDIIFANAANTVLFNVLKNQQIKAGLVIIEAKNYDKKKLGNQEFNQACGYTISNGREFVIIATRGVITESHIKKAKRHFLSHKVLILPISDTDILDILNSRGNSPSNFDLILAKRAQDIMSA